MSEEIKKRIDPTSLLPEEPMLYEFKKKKKKKKRKHHYEDPFKDVKESNNEPVQIMTEFEPEVTIKAEEIEVELDFNEYMNNEELLINAGQSEDSQEPAVPIESQKNQDAVLLTFESVIGSNSIFDYVEPQTHQEQLHACPICHQVFKSIRNLVMHERNKHQAHKNSFIYICNDCGLRYDKKNSLVAHQKRKHSPNSVPNDTEERVCEICSLAFKGNMRLRMHMQRKHNAFKDTFKYKCKDCDLTYDKYMSLLVHRKRKHGKVAVKKAQWYSCPLCQRGFTRRDAYSRHLQRKHNENVSEKKIPKEFLENFKDINSSGEIPCKECPLVFSSMMYLKLHMRRKHNAYKEDFRLKCNICNLSYDKIESLKRHVRRKHGDGTYCKDCSTDFETRELFLKHKHPKPIIECDKCGLIFASRGGLQKHLRCTHKIDTGPKTVFCHVCKEGFYENRQLKGHLMKVHLNITYPCKFCKKQFKTKESYTRHSLRFHSDNFHNVKKEYKCALCDADRFDTEFELCSHINTVHPNSTEIKIENAPPVIKKEIDHSESKDITFQCTRCPEVCANWQELRKHYEQFHHVLEETQCQACGQFLPENELPKHMKTIHPIETVQKCPYCEFETTSKISLTQHTLRHKNASTITCEYQGCRYKTFYQAAMDKHKKRHAELGKKLQCSQCPFQTMNKYILRYHEEVHATGKKKYACDQCDYATILPANLVQHKYKHSLVKRFKCEYCPFASKYNTSLRFHVRKKHCDLQV